MIATTRLETFYFKEFDAPTCSLLVDCLSSLIDPFEKCDIFERALIKLSQKVNDKIDSDQDSIDLIPPMFNPRSASYTVPDNLSMLLLVKLLNLSPKETESKTFLVSFIQVLLARVITSPTIDLTKFLQIFEKYIYFPVAQTEEIFGLHLTFCSNILNLNSLEKVISQNKQLIFESMLFVNLQVLIIPSMSDKQHEEGYLKVLNKLLTSKNPLMITHAIEIIEGSQELLLDNNPHIALEVFNLLFEFIDDHLFYTYQNKTVLERLIALPFPNGHAICSKVVSNQKEIIEKGKMVSALICSSIFKKLEYYSLNAPSLMIHQNGHSKHIVEVTLNFLSIALMCGAFSNILVYLQHLKDLLPLLENFIKKFPEHYVSIHKKMQFLTMQSFKNIPLTNQEDLLRNEIALLWLKICTSLRMENKLKEEE